MASIKIQFEDLPGGNLRVTFTPALKDFAFDYKLANRTPSEAEAAAISIAHYLKERDKAAKSELAKESPIWTPGKL